MHTFTCSCCCTTYYGESERHFLVRASSGHFGMIALTRKHIKNPKKSAIFGQILLKGHIASYEDFPIPLKESNKFRLHQKQSFLIKGDKPELNRNI